MSDYYTVNVCGCGSFGKLNTCQICGSSDYRVVEIPYASVLLMHDLQACGIKCKISAHDELVPDV